MPNIFKCLGICREITYIQIDITAIIFSLTVFKILILPISLPKLTVIIFTHTHTHTYNNYFQGLLI